MPSIFSQIVAGEVPCYKVAETKDFLAFLDVRPVMPGHTLVIPKKEVNYLYDLDDETYIGLHLLAKAVAKALIQAVPCQRIASAVIGLEVPHAHIHLVPINTMADMSFEKARSEPGNDQLAALAQQIRGYL